MSSNTMFWLNAIMAILNFGGVVFLDWGMINCIVGVLNAVCALSLL